MSQPTITNAALFVAAGQTLFGERWQQPLAALLSWPVDEKGQNRTVQRIKAAAEKGEEYRIAPGAMLELSQHLAQRAAEAQDLSKRIERLNKPQT